MKNYNEIDEYLINKSETIIRESNESRPVGLHLVLGFTTTLVICCFLPQIENYKLAWLIFIIIYIISSTIIYHLYYIITVDNYKEYRYAKKVLKYYYKQEDETYIKEKEQKSKAYIEMCKQYLKQKEVR